MAKIFVDVHTPGNGKIYEFQLDSTLTVGQLKTAIIEEISEMEKGNITLNPEKTILCNINSRVRLVDSENLRVAGVKSGQSLLLL